MLSGVGKSGVDLDPALDGRLVAATGVMIRRGTLDMLQVDAIDAEDGPAAIPSRCRSGRWRLVGEICDGKCGTGAMRPGNGLAHRACAMLCLAGGVPPVFVTVQPGGGCRVPAARRARTAAPARVAAGADGVRLVLDGALERRGDLLVFRADPGARVQ